MTIKWKYRFLRIHAPKISSDFQNLPTNTRQVKLTPQSHHSFSIKKTCCEFQSHPPENEIPRLSHELQGGAPGEPVQLPGQMRGCGKRAGSGGVDRPEAQEEEPGERVPAGSELPGA